MLMNWEDWCQREISFPCPKVLRAGQDPSIRGSELTNPFSTWNSPLDEARTPLGMCWVSWRLVAWANTKPCWLVATRKTYIMNRLWGPHLGENVKWKTEEKGAKSDCTHRLVKCVLRSLYGWDPFFLLFEFRSLACCLFGFDVAARLIFTF